MKAKDLDKLFDDGEIDINDYLDLSKAFRPGQQQKRVNVDFPVWMIDRLDREAGRLGVPRQSLIKVWIGEHLERVKTRQTENTTDEPADSKRVEARVTCAMAMNQVKKKNRHVSRNPGTAVSSLQSDCISQISSNFSHGKHPQHFSHRQKTYSFMQR